MSVRKVATAILISGRGSNMKSLVAAAEAPDYPAKIVHVISNRPDAGGIAWAREKGLAVTVIDHKAYPSREAFEADLEKVLIASGAELVALAGFMRLMTADFVGRWQTRMINIHPSLLPSFKGLDTHARALAEGVRIHGCSVHYVRAEVDSGPIIAQAAVPVLAGDTEASLAARVLAAEHKLYPMALRLVASGTAAGGGQKVTAEQYVNDTEVLFSPKC